MTSDNNLQTHANSISAILYGITGIVSIAVCLYVGRNPLTIRQ
jgi:hypothetical protein